MADYSQYFGNNLGFSKADTLGDVSKSLNSGEYLNTITPDTGISDMNFSMGGVPATDQSWYSKLFPTKDATTGQMSPDYMGTGLSLLKSGLGFYLGSQQLGQAEDALAENKRQFNLNYDAQKTLINDELAWQYNARKNRNSNSAAELTQIS